MKNKNDKTRRLLPAVLALLAFATIPAHAATTNIGGVTWTYNLVFSTARVLKAEPVSGNMTVPAKLGGHSTTIIGTNAFQGNSGLTGISFPDSLYDVGNQAFQNCSNLRPVSLGNGLIRIGHFAFQGCNIQSVTFPPTLEAIGEFAFADNKLTSVFLPAKVSSVGTGAFAGNASLASISVAAGNTNYISKDGILFSKDGKELAAFPGGKNGTYKVPSTVRRIWGYAFCGTQATSIVVPDAVEELGASVFRSSGNLVSVVLPSGLKTLPASCFSYCRVLQNIPFPPGLADIQSWAFLDCRDLRNISIPSGVTNIGYMAFSGCSSLETLALPPALRTIGAYAFERSGLTVLVIPPAVKRVGEGAFENCLYLAKLYVPEAWRGTDMLAQAEVPAGCEIIYYQSASQTVWRFYSQKNKGHFYTISEAEKNQLISSNPNWKFERGAYRAHTAQAPGTVPLYRFYSQKYKGHFYTVSESEKANLIASNPNWKYERVAYYVYPCEIPGSVPVFRFWSQKHGHHFYTTSVSEKDDLIANNPNWKYERIAFWALPLDANKSSPKAVGARSRTAGTVAEAPVAVTTADGSDGAVVADGDEGTAWSPETADGSWLVLSFADAREVADVEVAGENLPEGTRILLSEDADAWTEEVPCRARYVWVLFPASDALPAVGEIRVMEE